MADAKQEKVFVDGLFVGKRTFEWGEIGALDIKVEEFKKFLDKHVNEKGYVKIDTRTTREGKLYAELNAFVPKTEETAPETKKPAAKKASAPAAPVQEPEDDDLPF